MACVPASFLLPASHSEVNRLLKSFSTSRNFETARRIADKFKVSKYVILRRAFDLDFISSDQYWETYNEFRGIDIRNRPKSVERQGGNYDLPPLVTPLVK